MNTDFSLYLVTDPELGGGAAAVPGIVSQAVSGGVTVVQLRDKDASEVLFHARAVELLEVCTTHDVPLFLNDRIGVAVELGCHLHIGQGDTTYVQARRALPDHLMVGLTIENMDQLHRVIAECDAAGVRLPDVVGLGPVRDTATKPDAPAACGVAGVAAIATVAKQHGMASVAIGGVDKSNAAELARTDIDGLCVVSEIMAAADPAAAAEELTALFQCPSRPRVLSIAGTDPTGGAGVQADLKSIAAAGGYGMSVITALVAQNTHGVRAVHTPPADFLDQQLDAVFTDVTVDAIKLGMLGNAATVRQVIRCLHTYSHGSVVLDPVMVSTSGDSLLDSDAAEALLELSCLVDVITPNIPELAALCGLSEAPDMEAAIAQARGLAAQTTTIVIVKGGHLRGPAADNAVVYPDGSTYLVKNPRVDTTNTHGTGCSLSAALATRLAGGASIEEALEWSTRWLNEALRGSDALQVGSGNGPVDHFSMNQRMLQAANTTPWEHLQISGLSGEDASSITRRAKRKSPAPALAPAGEFTAALWAATGDVLAEILDSGFIQALGSGTLSREEFFFYLDQDAQYLRQYSRALASLSTAAPDAPAQVEWAQSAAQCLVVEAELHRSYLGGKLSETGVSAPSPVTMAYTDFLLARVLSEDYVVGVAAVLPCYWLYAEIGLILAAQNHAEHPYREWLETYSGEDFLSGTTKAIARVEAAMAGAGPEQRVDAARAYLSACVHEREFFDQATRFSWR